MHHVYRGRPGDRDLDRARLVGFHGTVDKSILKIAIPAGLVGILLGWLLFKYVNTHLLKAVIGIEAIIFALQKLLEGRKAWTGPRLPLNKPKAAFDSQRDGETDTISWGALGRFQEARIGVEPQNIFLKALLKSLLAVPN
jgi:uncharacterized membrane protein YfcA